MLLELLQPLEEHVSCMWQGLVQAAFLACIQRGGAAAPVVPMGSRLAGVPAAARRGEGRVLQSEPGTCFELAAAQKQCSFLAFSGPALKEQVPLASPPLLAIEHAFFLYT